jgi:hypothetical protein
MRNDSALGVTVAWKSATADLAVLRIAGVDIQPHYSYRLCSVEHDRPISAVSATGFPHATWTDLNEASDFTVYGALRRDGSRDLSFSVPSPDQPARQTEWRGMSGAAVFAPGRGLIREVFGVVMEARDQFPNGKLFIAEIAKAYADRSFLELVKSQTGNEPAFTSLTSSQRARAEENFPFLAALYDYTETPAVKSASSSHSFEIDVTVDLSFEKLKDVIRGDDTGLHRYPPRSVLPSPDNDYQRLLLFLQAPGGYGKTSFLKRLIASAIDEGFVAFYLDVKPKTSDWSSRERLFDTCTRAGGNHAQFQKAVNQDECPTLMVIDGLNETKLEWEKIRAMLDELANNFDKLSIVAADRMNPDRSSLPPEFLRATLLPVEVARIADVQLREIVEKHSANKLLSVPFFLDKFYQMRTSQPQDPSFSQFGRADIIKHYVAEYGKSANLKNGGIDQTIDAMSEVAMSAYRDGSLQFKRELFAGRLMSDQVDELIDAGLLVSFDAATLFFSHQLIHDFLVASWLVKSGSVAWTRNNFDPATLEGRSFDALELASELLAAHADGFIIEVYDWNYRAALECILNLDAGLSGKESPLPVALKDAIFALRAEKMFDPFEHTRTSARTRSSSFRSGFNIDYAALRDVAELLSAIEKKYVPVEKDGGLYREWRALFLISERVNPEQWPQIFDSPLLGWTAASVFRRPGLRDPALVEFLVGSYKALRRSQPKDYRGGIATRWRIVHVLGASDHPPARELLQAIVVSTEEDEWVLYGAVRSLVEIASRAPDIDAAKSLLKCLIDALPRLPPKARREVRDVAILAGGGPSWWSELYSEAIHSALSGLDPEKSDQKEEIGRWKSTLRALASAGGHTGSVGS